MKPQSPACNRELLRQSLDDALSERQEEQLARHLEECAECQQELERLAGEKQDWSRVGDVLRREAAAGRLQTTTCRDEDAPYELAADFAVDFLEPSDKPDTLGRLGEIDISAVIGCGGMGIVLKGFQAELNRPVAVKVLAPHLATSGAARKRFAREAQAAAVIVHPNVMPILTVNSAGKLPYLVMPLVPCESLQQRIDREGPLEPLDVLRIGLQVARGLAAAHAQGLVHRDVKPANILLEKGVDRVMLTDFGLARAVDDATLTRTGVIAGTPQYMSPEQARGEPIDARSDLFSLGSVLYAMCTGRPPFRAETSYGILRRITDTEPRPIREVNVAVPGWLEGIVGRLHAKELGERFSSADEVAVLLETCLAHVQQPTVVPLPEECREPDVGNARRSVMRAAAAVGILSVVLLAGAAGAGLVAKLYRGPAPSRALNDAQTLNSPESNPQQSGADSTADSKTDLSPAELDWNAAAEEIQSLTSAGAELESDVDRLWERQPSASRDDRSTFPPDAPDTETMP